MTYKTMPDHIYVKSYKQDGCYRLCSDDQTESSDIEYVRADAVTNGHPDVLSEIDAERQRQIRKGYDAAHDDADDEGNHARAAAYYATAAYYQRQCGYVDSNDPDEFDRLNRELESVQRTADEDSVGYPWSSETKDIEYNPRDNLIKAAALIVAEIERIDREGASE